MITTEQKTELPPGWQWHYRDPKARSYVAEKPGQGIRSPGFPDEAQAAHWAHLKEESLKEDGAAAETPSLEKALHSALRSVQGAAERWKPLILNGATDAELTKAIANEWRLGGGGSMHGGFNYKGGKNPEFEWLARDCQLDVRHLKGKRLLAKVRDVLGIGAPGQFVHDDLHAAAEDGDGFHPGFPPNFDPERAARGLAQDAPAPNGHHPQLQMVPLDQIAPSPTNPRKYFDPDKLQELADSIQEHGLAQPILVRPIPEDQQGFKLDRKGNSYDIPPFELVAGERRWRAAKIAGLKEIEAKVRDLDDKAVLEIQFVENLQRTDLSPIEEAEGYKRLLDEHGYTAESLAGKLAKSKSYVYGRLKLCNLPPAAMDALAKGDLPATVGELIGRLPSAELREKFWEDNFLHLGQDWFEAPSFRDVKMEIERGYMRELKSAPWNKKDATLVREAGACFNCPKMTGNNGAEFPESRADMCTDTPCFDRKLKAHFERQVQKAEKSGARVLDEPKSRKMFNTNGDSAWLTHEAQREYVELKDKPWGDKEDRSYKQLLDGHVEPVVAIDPLGKAHYLAPRAEAEKILKEEHGIKPESRSAMDNYKAPERKRQEEKKLRQATAAEIVYQALAGLEYNILADTDFLRLVAKFLIDKGGADVARAIAKRREIEYDTNNVRRSVEAFVNGLDGPLMLAGLVVEWLLQRELEYWAQWGSQDEFILCDYFDLKPKVIQKQVAAKAKEAAKKAKPKAKAKAASGR